MQFDTLKIISPALRSLPQTEAEAFGFVVWLWMQTADHQDLPLCALHYLLLPPIKRGQYALALAQVGGVTQPVAYMAWANLDADAESRYLHNPATGLMQNDWASGDRMWITDWFAPFGHARPFGRTLRKLLPNSCARYLDHRGNERGMNVRTCEGAQVAYAQARQWWSQRPMLAYTPPPTAQHPAQAPLPTES